MTSLSLCLIICLTLTWETRQAPANIRDAITATTKLVEITQEADARKKRNIEVPPPEIVCKTRMRTTKPHQIVLSTINILILVALYASLWLLGSQSQRFGITLS